VKLLVVEDEAPSARRLLTMLARVAPVAEVVARLASVDELVRWQREHAAPDLMLADIELRDGTVFAALELLAPAAPIIFTTAYDRYLLDAFRAPGIGYLLKPFSERELAAALAKYEDLRSGFTRTSRAVLDGLLARLAAEQPRHRRHFTVKRGRRIQVLPIERVALVRLGLAGVEIVGGDGASYFATEQASLGEIAATLPPARFFRINRNELVYLEAIEHIEPRDDRLAVALRGLPAPCLVSVHRTAAFRRWVGLSPTPR
jgi:two-component system, LytTR family, response regulator